MQVQVQIPDLIPSTSLIISCPLNTTAMKKSGKKT